MKLELSVSQLERPLTVQLLQCFLSIISKQIRFIHYWSAIIQQIKCGKANPPSASPSSNQQQVSGFSILGDLLLYLLNNSDSPSFGTWTLTSPSQSKFSSRSPTFFTPAEPSESSQCCENWVWKGWTVLICEHCSPMFSIWKTHLECFPTLLTNWKNWKFSFFFQFGEWTPNSVSTFILCFFENMENFPFSEQVILQKLSILCYCYISMYCSSKHWHSFLSFLITKFITKLNSVNPNIVGVG